MKENYLRVSAFILIGAFFAAAMTLFAYSTGITGRTSLSDTPGCTCHGANPSTNVSVQINGPDSLEPGQTATYTVSISGGPANAAGTDIAVSSGTLTPVSTTLQKVGNELTHASPVNFGNNNSVTFEFRYTADNTPGEVTMAANGNSVNLNGSNGGDEWNYAPDKVITVQSANGIADLPQNQPEDFQLMQNYPNPFGARASLSGTAVTTIRYRLTKSAPVTLEVFDLSGKKVRTLVNNRQNSGNHQVRFDSANLPAGIYLYRLTVNGQSQVRRMAVLK